MRKELLKSASIVLGLSFAIFFSAGAGANKQEKKKALSTEYGVTADGKLDIGIFKKECFMECQKSYDNDMIKKCKEVPGKINKDLSVLEEGGCFDTVKLENDKCISACFIGRPNDEAVKAYDIEVYQPAKAKEEDPDADSLL